jgi:hypothetical protein
MMLEALLPKNTQVVCYDAIAINCCICEYLMENLSQSSPDTIDDLTKADARTFAAAYGVQADNSEPTDIKQNPKISPTQDSRVLQAVKQAQVVRAAYDKPRPIALYVAVAVTLALVVAISIALSLKTQNSASSSNSSGASLTIPTPDSSGTNGLSKQVQQDLKNCSNVVNAALEC